MDRARVNRSAPGGHYTASRSFVVQLRDDQPHAAQDVVRGRVENVATGENTVFDSLRELEQFMRRSAPGNG